MSPDPIRSNVSQALLRNPKSLSSRPKHSGADARLSFDCVSRNVSDDRVSGLSAPVAIGDTG